MSFRGLVRAGAEIVKGVIESRRKYGPDSYAVVMPVRPLLARLYSNDDGFLPSDVAGLELWFDASEGVYTTEDATTVAAADGAAVGAWRDKSTNARLFVQATAASRPTLKLGANGINNRPVIRGDGTADHLKLDSAVLGATSGSVFAVVRLTSPLQNGQVIVSSGDEADVTKYWTCTALATTTDPNIATQQRDADTQDFVRGGTDLVAGTPYLFTFGSTGTAYVLRVNGATETNTVVTGADNGDWTADTSAQDNTALFALVRASVVSYLKGDIAELLVYEPAVSAADRTRLELYLAAKYGVSI